MRNQLRPLFDQVVIKELEPDRVRASGLVVPPGTHEPPPQHGILLAVGPGLDWWGGVGTAMPVKPGDHVVFPASAGAWVEVDEERLLVCRVGELLGVLEQVRDCPRCAGGHLPRLRAHRTDRQRDRLALVAQRRRSDLSAAGYLDVVRERYVHSRGLDRQSVPPGDEHPALAGLEPRELVPAPSRHGRDERAQVGVLEHVRVRVGPLRGDQIRRDRPDGGHARLVVGKAMLDPPQPMLGGGGRQSPVAVAAEDRIGTVEELVYSVAQRLDPAHIGAEGLTV